MRSLIFLGASGRRNAEKKGLFFRETFCHGTRFVKVSTLRQHFAAVGQTQSCLLDTIATAIANVRYTLKYFLKIQADTWQMTTLVRY